MNGTFCGGPICQIFVDAVSMFINAEAESKLTLKVQVIWLHPE
jgi:hypothetical protein